MNNVILSNDPTAIKNDFLTLLQHAVASNQIGYMDGMDPDTGDIVPLLVGLEFNPENENEIKAYPLAQIFLNPADLKNYLAPDGNGNYVNLKAPEEE